MKTKIYLKVLFTHADLPTTKSIVRIDDFVRMTSSNGDDETPLTVFVFSGRPHETTLRIYLSIERIDAIMTWCYNQKLSGSKDLRKWLTPESVEVKNKGTFTYSFFYV